MVRTFESVPASSFNVALSIAWTHVSASMMTSPGYTLGVTPPPHNEGDFTALGRASTGRPHHLGEDEALTLVSAIITPPGVFTGISAKLS